MPVMPAFCDDCGTPFPSGFSFENCFEISMTGSKSSPCPKCGGVGSIPDGVFNVFGNVIEILDAPRKTIDQLEKYTKVLNEARDQKLSREEIKVKIDKEIPELSGISSYLPATRTELYAFLTLFLTLIPAFVSLIQEQAIDIDVNIIINNTIEQIYNCSHSDTEPPKSEFSMPSRNDLCSCGSKNRFKDCCGQII